MEPEKQVSIADGAGGAASQRFIKNEILSRFSNPALDPLEDGSWISVDSNNLVVTADSFTIDPPIFPGGNIGHLAVSGIVNDLLASGGHPKHITLTLIISEEFPYETLRLILNSIAQVSKSSGITIIAGDTKIIEKDSLNGGICIHATGIGLPINPHKSYSVADVKVGDKIIVTGTIGDHGFAVLSYREGLGFERRVKSDCMPLDGLLIPILKKHDGIRSMRDPTRGGLVNSLIDFAENSDVDLIVHRDCIPIRPEVDFGCEMLGISPLGLVNEGKMVLAVAEEDAEQVLIDCRKSPGGKNAAIVGEAAPKRLIRGQLFLIENGLKKPIIRPEGLEIPRLC